MKWAAAVALILLALPACREVDDTIYMHYLDVPHMGWDMSHPMNFEAFPADSSYIGTPTRMELLVRYLESQPMAEIPVLASVEDENGDIISDTLRLKLFGPQGRPLDPPKFGIAEHVVPLLYHYRLRPGLSVNLIPLAPANASKGLLNIGVRLAKDADRSMPPKSSLPTKHKD